VRWPAWLLYFEKLSPASLPALNRYYAADARFKDPFNNVQGLSAIARIFEYMFTHLHQPRFVVTQRLVQGDQAFLLWDFYFHFKRGGAGRAQRIHGATHLRLNAQGLVLYHRDYWDAAEELYEKLPALGLLMRWLRRRLVA
jgi:steroid delta-isomerase